MTIHEIRVGQKDRDVKGDGVLHEARRTLDIQGLERVRTFKVYRLEGVTEEEAQKLRENLFCESIDQKSTLKFECRWINLAVEKNNACVFLDGMKESVSYQVAHGEGKFFTDPKQLHRIENEKLVVFRYVDALGKPTQEYPANPNGSLNAIAGITDSSGRILGLMPHPERFIRKTQHPNWRRMPDLEPQGLPIFEKMVNYATQM